MYKRGKETQTRNQRTTRKTHKHKITPKAHALQSHWAGGHRGQRSPGEQHASAHFPCCAGSQGRAAPCTAPSRDRAMWRWMMAPMRAKRSYSRTAGRSSTVWRSCCMSRRNTLASRPTSPRTDTVKGTNSSFKRSPVARRCQASTLVFFSFFLYPNFFSMKTEGAPGCSKSERSLDLAAPTQTKGVSISSELSLSKA